MFEMYNDLLRARWSGDRILLGATFSAPNGEVNISHENTTVVVWIYDGV